MKNVNKTEIATESRLSDLGLPREVQGEVFNLLKMAHMAAMSKVATHFLKKGEKMPDIDETLGFVADMSVLSIADAFGARPDTSAKEDIAQFLGRLHAAKHNAAAVRWEVLISGDEDIRYCVTDMDAARPTAADDVH